MKKLTKSNNLSDSISLKGISGISANDAIELLAGIRNLYPTIQQFPFASIQQTNKPGLFNLGIWYIEGDEARINKIAKSQAKKKITLELTHKELLEKLYQTFGRLTVHRINEAGDYIVFSDFVRDLHYDFLTGESKSNPLDFYANSEFK